MMESFLADLTIADIDSMAHDVEECDASMLEHYGVKERSGRYPWGSGDRPHQRLEGRDLRKAVKSYNKRVKEKKKQEKKDEAKRKKEDKEKLKAVAEEAKAQKKSAKDRVSNLRDPGKLRMHQYEYSPEEVKDALNRFEWDKKLYEYDKARLQRGSDYMQTFLKYATSMVGIYNIGANVYNSVRNSPDAALPLISTGAGKQKEKKYGEDAKKKKKDS